MKKLTVIPALAASLLMATTLTGCSQTGPTSTSETVAGSSLEGGSTTDPGTGGIDPTAEATDSSDSYTGGQILKFTLGDQDYSAISPYFCLIGTDGAILSYAGGPNEEDPGFTVEYTPGQEADAKFSVSTAEFISFSAAYTGVGEYPGTALTLSFDQSTGIYSISGTMQNQLGFDGNTLPIEISATCK